MQKNLLVLLFIGVIGVLQVHAGEEEKWQLFKIIVYEDVKICLDEINPVINSYDSMTKNIEKKFVDLLGATQYIETNLSDLLKNEQLKNEKFVLIDDILVKNNPMSKFVCTWEKIKNFLEIYGCPQDLDKSFYTSEHAKELFSTILAIREGISKQKELKESFFRHIRHIDTHSFQELEEKYVKEELNIEFKKLVAVFDNENKEILNKIEQFKILGCIYCEERTKAFVNQLNVEISSYEDGLKRQHDIKEVNYEAARIFIAERFNRGSENLGSLLPGWIAL